MMESGSGGLQVPCRSKETTSVTIEANALNGAEKC